MAVTGYEYIQIQGDNITMSKLIWRRYRVPAPHIIELAYDINPHIADHMLESPFLPVLAWITIPIDPDVIARKPETRPAIMLYGSVQRQREQKFAES